MSLKIVVATLALSVLAGTTLLAQDQTPSEPSGNQPSSPRDPSQGSGESGAPRSIRVGGNVSQANLVYQVAPVYPAIAKSAHISGTVVLHAIIGQDGTVQNLQYISGPPLLMKSAMDAVQQWRYKPTLFNGDPVNVDTTLTVVFTLGGSNAEGSNDAVQTSEAPAPRVTSQRPQDSKAWPVIVRSAPLITRPAPIYPTDAIEKHIEGVVVVLATISEDGSVKKLEIESGPPELTDAAMDAVKRWQFTPTEVNGSQVETQRRIAILFSLTKNNYKLMATSFDPISAEVIASTGDAPPLKHPAASRMGQTPIPDTLDGIQKQTQEVFDAWRAGDKDKFQKTSGWIRSRRSARMAGRNFWSGQERFSCAAVRNQSGKVQAAHGARCRLLGEIHNLLRSTWKLLLRRIRRKKRANLTALRSPLKPLNIENFRFYVTTGQTGSE